MRTSCGWCSKSSDRTNDLAAPQHTAADRRSLGISPDSPGFCRREHWAPCDHRSPRGSPQPILPAARIELARPVVALYPWQTTKYTLDPPPLVGVIDPDPVARNGLRALLHRNGVDVSTFDSAESYLLAANGRQPGVPDRGPAPARDVRPRIAAPPAQRRQRRARRAAGGRVGRADRGRGDARRRDGLHREALRGRRRAEAGAEAASGDRRPHATHA